ncbi:MAG: hypothetical protein E7269_02965 [Lachnospiraceae bacterium]|nr:hypothetical protein [Lachnospiraceae bacterium]
MFEAGGILIVMCSAFLIGMISQGILSMFYQSNLKDASDMERPGKKLMKLSNLRYETSYYLNGTVHNAKSMVYSMLENYKMAGLKLWTWHHLGMVAQLLCGLIAVAVGALYVLGIYVPAVKNALPISGQSAAIHVCAGLACVVMLEIWQRNLDNSKKRKRLEMIMVDYFDNERYHQLGREIALSGRVRGIVGDRGMNEDPGSIAMEMPATEKKIKDKPEDDAAATSVSEPKKSRGKEKKVIAAEEKQKSEKVQETEKTPTKRRSTAAKKAVKDTDDVIVPLKRDSAAEETAATTLAPTKKRSGRTKTAVAKEVSDKVPMTEKEEQLLSLLREFMSPQN